MEKLCSLDWPTLSAFAFVFLTVVASTYLTIRYQNRATASQLKIAEDAGRRQIQLADEAGQRQITLAHEAAAREQEKLRAEAIAASRRVWINNLRDETSNFIAETYGMWDLHLQKIGRAEVLQAMGDSAFAMEELGQWSIRYGIVLTAMERSRAKVALLLNPNEDASKELLAAMDDSMRALTEKKNPKQENSRVIALLQPVLKSEWRRVKALDLA